MEEKENFSSNPFSGISSPKKTTFWEKCKETFFVFSGDFEKLGLIPYFLVGITPPAIVLSPALAFGVPLLSMLYFQDEKNNSPWWQWALAILFALPAIAAVLALVALIIAVLLAAGLVIAVTSLVLTFVSMPLIAMLHAFVGPSPKKHTSLWLSTLLNPSTWIMGAILTAGIGLLIQGINPLAFANAAMPLMIIQTVFASMATLAVLGTLAYGAYRIGRWLCYSQEELPDDWSHYSEGELPDESNYITKYLSERWRWARHHPIPATLVWGLGALGLLVVVGLTIDYFVDGALFGSLMAPVFEFMSHEFLSSIHAVFGLTFLGSLSDPTLLFIGQIVSTVTLISAAVFIPDNMSRFLEAMTTVDKAVLADRADEPSDSSSEENDSGNNKQEGSKFENIYHENSTKSDSNEEGSTPRYSYLKNRQNH